MTYIKALELLNDGNIITRTSWNGTKKYLVSAAAKYSIFIKQPNNMFRKITINDTQIIEHVNNNYRVICNIPDEYIEATDWEVCNE